MSLNRTQLADQATARLQTHVSSTYGADFGQPEAIDVNRTPYVVLCGGFLMHAGEPQDVFIRRLDRLCDCTIWAVDENCREGGGIWVRSGPTIDIETRPDSAAQFLVSDLWPHDDADQLVYARLRLSRKDGEPVLATWLPIKREGASVPIINVEEPA